MWICPKCGEEVDSGFEVCWGCGTSPEGVEDPTFFDTEAEDVLPVETGITAESPPASQDLVTIAMFDSAQEAYLARHYLRVAGIVAYLADEHISGVTFWPGAIPNFARVKLQVSTRDAERALEFLAEKPGKTTSDRPRVEDEDSDEPEERIWRPK